MQRQQSLPHQPRLACHDKCGYFDMLDMDKINDLTRCEYREKGVKRDIPIPVMKPRAAITEPFITKISIPTDRFRLRVRMVAIISNPPEEEPSRSDSPLPNPITTPPNTAPSVRSVTRAPYWNKLHRERRSDN